MALNLVLRIFFTSYPCHPRKSVTNSSAKSVAQFLLHVKAVATAPVLYRVAAPVDRSRYCFLL